MSNYKPEAVVSYFDAFGLGEWERMVSDPIAEVKHFVHSHYLREFVPAGSRVLEIGAGPGRYTQLLAERGCRVTVTDISPVQIDLNKAHAEKYGFADAVETWHVLDMCEMPRFADGAFDVVLAYGGPLSYVMDRREVALGECVRVTRPGGRLLFGVMSLWGTAHAALAGVLHLPPDINALIVETGDLTEQTSMRGNHFCHMFRASELRGFLEAAGLTVQAMSASNVLCTNWGEAMAESRQDETKWQELLQIELMASAEAGCLDMGTHLIAVAKK